MNKMICLLLGVLCTGCASGAMMTSQNYQEMCIGQKAGDLEAKYGEPYEVRKLSDGHEEYIYLEHVPVTRTSEVVKEYIFVISNGQIVNKKMNEARSSSHQFTTH